MVVTHLSDEELDAFKASARDNPAVAKLNELEIAHVTEVGGIALDVWRLYQGVIFGDPIMMSADEVASRLELPVSEVEGIIEDVNAAVRPAWRETPEWKDSPFEKRERTGRWD